MTAAAKTALNAASHATSHAASHSAPPSRKAYYFYALSVSIALVASAVLVTVMANGQTVEPKAPAAPSASPTAASTVRYSAKDIDRAFNFMDANQDGVISREEAARFRNVARHFDEADTNKDNVLSHTEFSSALNRP